MYYYNNFLLSKVHHTEHCSRDTYIPLAIMCEKYGKILLLWVRLMLCNTATYVCLRMQAYLPYLKPVESIFVSSTGLRLHMHFQKDRTENIYIHILVQAHAQQKLDARCHRGRKTKVESESHESWVIDWQKQTNDVYVFFYEQVLPLRNTCMHLYLCAKCRVLHRSIYW